MGDRANQKGEFMKQQFSVKADNKLMMMLSSGVYKDKVLAVIRELGSNAIDAVTEHGGEVSIKLKTINNIHMLIISDTGCGLEPQQVIDLMSTYGNSTKRDNNKVNGKFGIGSKSPFAYSDEFFIKSNKNGKSYYFKCYKDNQGIPFIEFLKEEETTEPSGLTFSIEVKTKDLKSFILDIVGFTITQETSTPVTGVIDLQVLEADINISSWNNKFPDNYLHNIKWRIKPSLTTLPDNQKLLNLEKYKIGFEKQISGIAINGKMEYSVNWRFLDSVLNKLYDEKQQNIYNKVFIKDYIGAINLGKILIKIGSMVYESPFDMKIPFMDKIIIKMNPKDITVTSSREDIVHSEQNRKKFIEQVTKYNEYLKAKFNPQKSIIDQINDHDSAISKFFRAIGESDVSQHDKLNKDICFQFEDDRNFLLSLNISESEHSNNERKMDIIFHNRANFRILYEFDKTWNGRTPMAVNNQTFQITSKHNIVVCMFPRQSVDIQKILDNFQLSKKNTIILFSNSRDLKDIMAAKKFHKYLSLLDTFKNKVYLINKENRKQFARTRNGIKSQASGSIINGAKYYDFEVKKIRDNKLYDYKVTAQETSEPDNSKHTIYAFIHRNMIHLVTDFTCTPDMTPMRKSAGKMINSYKMRFLSPFADKLQLCLFSSRKNALNYFKKHPEIKVNFYKDVSKFILSELVSDDKYKYVRHAITVLLKNEKKLSTKDVYQALGGAPLFVLAARDLLGFDTETMLESVSVAKLLLDYVVDSRCRSVYISQIDKLVNDADLYQKITYLIDFEKNIDEIFEWKYCKNEHAESWNLYKEVKINKNPDMQKFDIFKKSFVKE